MVGLVNYPRVKWRSKTNPPFSETVETQEARLLAMRLLL
jgi:hypothetical protein